MPADSAQRTCSRCGRDCRGVKHVGNGKGWFACWDCYRAMQAERQAAAVSADPGADPIDSEADTYDIAPPEVEPQRIACPACLAPMPAASRRCPACGHDRRNPPPPKPNHAAPVRQRPAHTCRHCHYDLSGIGHLERCPECGNAIPRNFNEHNAALAEQVAREAWRKPLLMLAVGFAVAVAATFIEGLVEGGTLQGAQDALVYGAVFGGEVIFGLLAFMLCAFLWLGMDQPIRLAMLQIAGAYAVADAVWVGMTLLPVGPFGLILWIIWIAVYIGLLADALDLELNDAILVAVFTGVAKIVVGVLIASMLLN